MVGAALAMAVWLQRGTIGDALGELRTMSAKAVALLAILAVVDRVIRADIVRRLLDVTFGRAWTIHDVGAAANKGIPLGAPLSTALRWSIARDASVATTSFTHMLVAYGVATTFVTWLLPFGVLVVDVGLRSPTSTDVAMLAVCVVVLTGAAAFWVVILRSDRVTAKVVAVIVAVSDRVARRFPSVADHDPVGSFIEIRSALRATARRPTWLLAQTTLTHSIGALILLVALRDLGVGQELGLIEFLRVFFVVTLLSSFVPVPGGVGVVEAGLTGALVLAGVAAPVALAGVLVYRLLTYVTPIVVGTLLYAVWRIQVRRRSLPACDVDRPEPLAIDLHRTVAIE